MNLEAISELETMLNRPTPKGFNRLIGSFTLSRHLNTQDKDYYTCNLLSLCVSHPCIQYSTALGSSHIKRITFTCSNKIAFGSIKLLIRLDHSPDMEFIKCKQENLSFLGFCSKVKRDPFSVATTVCNSSPT